MVRLPSLALHFLLSFSCAAPIRAGDQLVADRPAGRTNNCSLRAQGHVGPIDVRPAWGPRSVGGALDTAPSADPLAFPTEGVVTGKRQTFGMALRPGSRPRGSLTRPYARSINLSTVEFILIRRWADKRGLAVGAAIRQLAVIGLVADAPEGERSDWDTASLESVFAYFRTAEPVVATVESAPIGNRLGAIE